MIFKQIKRHSGRKLAQLLATRFRVVACSTAILLVVYVALLGRGSRIAPVPATAQTSTQSAVQDKAVVAPSTRIQPTSVSVINFSELANKESSTGKKPMTAAQQSRAVHPPMTITEVDTMAPEPPVVSVPKVHSGPLVVSPAPSQSFLAQEDAAEVGTGTSHIPPDTMGAVGLDKLFVSVNNNYRIQNKLTGTALSTVSINTFWAPSGGSGVFDPRVQFDPYNSRWIVVAVSNPSTASSSILVGISSTADPQGSYTLFRFTVGCAANPPTCPNGEWADFPMLGFNKNWITVGWNQFSISGGAFVAGKMLILDYPSLRAGTSNSMIFTVPATTNPANFCMHPATTLSATEETLYVPVHFSSGGATYRLHKITGTPAAPVFNLDATSRTRPGGGWTQPSGDLLPQTCIGTPGTNCPTTPRAVDSGDAFIRSNVVFRSGNVWYPQTIALPAGGLGAATHTAVQWTRIDTSGTFVDGGRVEDSTATSANGGEWYAYPSLAVNMNNDVLLGFSNFSSADLIDAGYAFRFGTDPAGTMRDPIVFKEGEDYYSKSFSGTRNRFGDYSHTVVDPSNDLDLWTIQEYAGLRTLKDSQQTTNNSRWGTWWAKVSVAGPTPTPSPTPSPSPSPSPSPGGCSSGNKLLDPGFEASTGTAPITNPFWASTSTQFGTSFCSDQVCTSNSAAAPRNGIYWTWFGGTEGPESGTVSQVVTIPSGATATLNYYLWIGLVTSPFTDVFNVKVDGTIVQTFTEPSFAGSGYVLRSVNLNAYANGGQHTILMEYASPNGGGLANFNVDDVTLEVLCQSGGSSSIQFSTTNYNAGEGDVSVIVTVNRSGDTSGAATVDFASSNGTASQLRDYEVANGTLTFAAGQTSRTFRVLVVDDVYAESNETVNLTLSNPVGASMTAPTTATVTIVDNDSGGSTSPTARQFVSNLTGADEVPATPNTVKGNGGIVQLSTDELSAKVSLLFSGLTGGETGAHVHAGAPGVNGPIIFPLPPGNPINNFVVNPTAQQVADLRAGQQYMNVHSSGFLNGEIRGQLLWNPAEEADFFVRQAYFDFLSRVPDTSGFNFWVAEITNCQSDVECLRRKRVDVSNAFFYEQEFQQTAAYVLRLYRGAYGNNQPFPNPNPNAGFPNEEKKLPSYAVFVADRARVIGGASLPQSQLALANLFVTRPEFLTKYPTSLATADQFVDALLLTLQNDLGVNLSSQRANLISIYNTQGGRGAVLYRLSDDNAAGPVANQPFIDEEYNRSFVLGQYFGYLRRNPDIPGFVFWLGQVNGAPLRNVAKQHAMVCSFITAAEFQLRFGPVASRNNNECPQ